MKIGCRRWGKNILFVLTALSVFAFYFIHHHQTEYAYSRGFDNVFQKDYINNFLSTISSANYPNFDSKLSINPSVLSETFMLNASIILPMFAVDNSDYFFSSVIERASIAPESNKKSLYLTTFVLNHWIMRKPFVAALRIRNSTRQQWLAVIENFDKVGYFPSGQRRNFPSFKCIISNAHGEVAYTATAEFVPNRMHFSNDAPISEGSNLRVDIMRCPLTIDDTAKIKRFAAADMHLTAEIRRNGQPLIRFDVPWRQRLSGVRFLSIAPDRPDEGLSDTANVPTFTKAQLHIVTSINPWCDLMTTTASVSSGKSVRIHLFIVTTAASLSFNRESIRAFMLALSVHFLQGVSHITLLFSVHLEQKHRIFLMNLVQSYYQDSKLSMIFLPSDSIQPAGIRNNFIDVDGLLCPLYLWNLLQLNMFFYFIKGMADFVIVLNSNDFVVGEALNHASSSLDLLKSPLVFDILDKNDRHFNSNIARNRHLHFHPSCFLYFRVRNIHMSLPSSSSSSTSYNVFHSSCSDGPIRSSLGHATDSEKMALRFIVPVDRIFYIAGVDRVPRACALGPIWDGCFRYTGTDNADAGGPPMSEYSGSAALVERVYNRNSSKESSYFHHCTQNLGWKDYSNTVPTSDVYHSFDDPVLLEEDGYNLDDERSRRDDIAAFTSSRNVEEEEEHPNLSLNPQEDRGDRSDVLVLRNTRNNATVAAITVFSITVCDATKSKKCPLTFSLSTSLTTATKHDGRGGWISSMANMLALASKDITKRGISSYLMSSIVPSLDDSVVAEMQKRASERLAVAGDSVIHLLPDQYFPIRGFLQEVNSFHMSDDTELSSLLPLLPLNMSRSRDDPISTDSQQPATTLPLSNLPSFSDDFSEIFIGSVMEREAYSTNLVLTTFLVCHAAVRRPRGADDRTVERVYPSVAAVSAWKTALRIMERTKYDASGMRVPPSVLSSSAHKRMYTNQFSVKVTTVSLRQTQGKQHETATAAASAVVVQCTFVPNRQTPDGNANQKFDVLRCPLHNIGIAFVNMSEFSLEAQVMKLDLPVIRFRVPWDTRVAGFMGFSSPRRTGADTVIDSSHHHVEDEGWIGSDVAGGAAQLRHRPVTTTTETTHSLYDNFEQTDLLCRDDDDASHCGVVVPHLQRPHHSTSSATTTTTTRSSSIAAGKAEAVDNMFRGRRTALTLDAWHAFPMGESSSHATNATKMHKIVICGGIWRSSVSIHNIPILLEWIEHNIQIGVDHIIFGVTFSWGSDHMRVLKRALHQYISEGYISLALYNTDGLDFIAHFAGAAWSDDYIHVYFDNMCLYFAKGIADYVAVWDFDEFFIPLGSNTKVTDVLSKVDYGNEFYSEASSNKVSIHGSTTVNSEGPDNAITTPWRQGLGDVHDHPMCFIYMAAEELIMAKYLKHESQYAAGWMKEIFRHHSTKKFGFRHDKSIHSTRVQFHIGLHYGGACKLPVQSTDCHENTALHEEQQKSLLDNQGFCYGAEPGSFAEKLKMEEKVVQTHNFNERVSKFLDAKLINKTTEGVLYHVHYFRYAFYKLDNPTFAVEKNAYSENYGVKVLDRLNQRGFYWPIKLIGDTRYVARETMDVAKEEVANGAAPSLIATDSSSSLSSMNNNYKISRNRPIFELEVVSASMLRINRDKSTKSKGLNNNTSTVTLDLVVFIKGHHADCSFIVDQSVANNCNSTFLEILAEYGTIYDAEDDGNRYLSMQANIYAANNQRHYTVLNKATPQFPSPSVKFTNTAQCTAQLLPSNNERPVSSSAVLHCIVSGVSVREQEYIRGCDTYLSGEADGGGASVSQSSSLEEYDNHNSNNDADSSSFLHHRNITTSTAVADSPSSSLHRRGAFCSSSVQAAHLKVEFVRETSRRVQFSHSERHHRDDQQDNLNGHQRRLGFLNGAASSEEGAEVHRDTLLGHIHANRPQSQQVLLPSQKQRKPKDGADCISFVIPAHRSGMGAMYSPLTSTVSPSSPSTTPPVGNDVNYGRLQEDRAFSREVLHDVDDTQHNHIDDNNIGDASGVTTTTTTTIALCLASPWSIVVVTRSTTAHIVEFIQHHLNVGFSHLFIPVDAPWDSSTMKQLRIVLRSYIEGDRSITLFSVSGTGMERNPTQQYFAVQQCALHALNHGASFLAVWESTQFFVLSEIARNSLGCQLSNQGFANNKANNNKKENIASLNNGLMQCWLKSINISADTNFIMVGIAQVLMDGFITNYRRSDAKQLLWLGEIYEHDPDPVDRIGRDSISPSMSRGCGGRNGGGSDSSSGSGIIFRLAGSSSNIREEVTEPHTIRTAANKKKFNASRIFPTPKSSSVIALLGAIHRWISQQQSSARSSCAQTASSDGDLSNKTTINNTKFRIPTTTGDNSASLYDFFHSYVSGSSHCSAHSLSSNPDIITNIDGGNINPCTNFKEYAHRHLLRKQQMMMLSQQQQQQQLHDPGIMHHDGPHIMRHHGLGEQEESELLHQSSSSSSSSRRAAVTATSTASAIVGTKNEYSRFYFLSVYAEILRRSVDLFVDAIPLRERGHSRQAQLQRYIPFIKVWETRLSNETRDVLQRTPDT